MDRLQNIVRQLGVPLLILWGGLFAYFMLVLHSLFLSGKFGFEDLTLLNSIFSNTAYGRGFFWVTHDAQSHFRLQFTPTLLFLVPFYRVFESQFILLALGNIAYYLSILIFLILFHKILVRHSKESGHYTIPSWVVSVVPFVFLVLMSSNRYAKNVLASGHYEVFFLLLWSGLAYALFENKGWLLTLSLFLLNVGLRSDASFFLFFQMVALNFIPSWTMKDARSFRKRIRLLAVLCIFYFVVLVSLINPSIGTVNNFARWWGHLGNNPFEIMTSVITSPSMLFSAIIKGGFLSLNLSFFFLSLFHPLYFLMINIPAIPNYLMLFPDRSNLFCYHSGFFLPTLYLGSFLGMIKLFDFFGQRWQAHSKTMNLCFGFVFGLIFISQILTWTHTNNGYRFKLHPNQEQSLFSDITQFLKEHPEVKSVASDWGAIVYAPNSLEPRALYQYDKADLVILPRSGRALLSGFVTYNEAQTLIRTDPKYQEVYSTERASFLLRTGR